MFPNKEVFLKKSKFRMSDKGKIIIADIKKLTLNL